MTGKMFSLAFEAALAHVLKSEGGWSDHAKDPGGATMMGVTLKLFREWRRNPAMTKADLKAITRDEVRQIYHDLFWRNIKGDELKPAVALMAMDTAVNSGVRTAIKTLQRAANEGGPFKLIADGVLGPQSLTAINAIEPSRLLDAFGAQRMVFYGLLPIFPVFCKGWSRRLFAARAAAGLLIDIGRAVLASKPATPETFKWPTL